MEELLPLAAAAMMGGVDVSAQVVLALGGNFERNLVQYNCEDGSSLVVDYINADPNYLAILPVRDRKLVFVAVLAASGVKYVSGPHVWWTKGGSADLTDETNADAPPISCLEATETP